MIGASVLEAIPHALKCCGSRNGPAMQFASAHVRIAPKEELAQSVFEGTPEDAIFKPHASLMRMDQASQK